MITETLHVDPTMLERHTGWSIKPEGACKNDRCVPLGTSALIDGRIDLRLFADRLGMPIVYDEEHALWSLGPEAGGHALGSTQAPELVLPDLDGALFHLRSLRGTKVLLVAWASW